MTLSIQIAKFKFRQYQMRAILILAKSTCYNVLWKCTESVPDGCTCSNSKLVLSSLPRRLVSLNYLTYEGKECIEKYSADSSWLHVATQSTKWQLIVWAGGKQRGLLCYLTLHLPLCRRIPETIAKLVLTFLSYKYYYHRTVLCGNDCCLFWVWCIRQC